MTLLQLDYVPYARVSQALSRLDAEGRQVLGIASFGRTPPDAALLPQAVADVPWPHVGLPSLQHAVDGWVEVWSLAPDAPRVTQGVFESTDGGTGERHHAGVAYSRSGELGFAWLAAPLGNDDLALAGRTQQAYDAVWQAMRTLGLPHAWRVWNYLPDILGSRQGEERYRIFNAGRLAAFQAHATQVDSPPPAACALGQPEGASGPLVIYALLGAQAALPIENPRQVSAYRYPPQYGQQRPQFSRASVAQLGGQGLAFLSGTASIVGHASVHAGDVHAQTLETLRNIDALLDQIRQDSGQAWAHSQLAYKAYVRHADDLPVVRELMRAHLGPDATLVFVQAVVCRPDLLVEIEASAARSLPLPF